MRPARRIRLSSPRDESRRGDGVANVPLRSKKTGCNRPSTELVELSGTQGVELPNWLVARGTLPQKVRKQQANYHIPISNTASGLMLLEGAA